MKSKLKKNEQQLLRMVYAGLQNLNNGFDSPAIYHTSPENFITVIERCQKLKLEIIGVEVFTTLVKPPLKARMLDMKISPGTGKEWARRLVQHYVGQRGITVSATLNLSSAPIPKGKANLTKALEAMKGSQRKFTEPPDTKDSSLEPGLHKQLLQIAIRLPTDYEPYGQMTRETCLDCSAGCLWYLVLAAHPLDWGVCTNPASPRVGLLTFEHQGCKNFVSDHEEPR